MLIYLIPPLLGAFIGYLTNVIAIELLFHPRKPINILGFRIQGVIPSRSEEIIERLLDSVGNFLNEEDFQYILDRAILRSYTESSIREKVEGVFNLPVLNGIAAKYGIAEKIAATIADSVTGLVRDAFSRKVASNIDLKELIIKKAEEVTEEEVEHLFKTFARKELRFIELSGAVLGFIIGSFQSLALYFLL